MRWASSGAPSLTLDVETDAGAFFPLAWSPDGGRIAGRQITPQGIVPAIYTPATDRLQSQPHPGGWGGNIVWLPDGRRILAWDGRRDVATLWDTVTQELHDVPGLPGPSDVQLSADGRTLILNRQIAEGDIWMLTLE